MPRKIDDNGLRLQDLQTNKKHMSDDRPQIIGSVNITFSPFPLFRSFHATIYGKLCSNIQGDIHIFGGLVLMCRVNKSDLCTLI